MKCLQTDDATLGMCNEDFSSPWEKEVTNPLKVASDMILDRQATVDTWKDAANRLHQVMEYLREVQPELLLKSDNRSLGNIANNFCLRHHNLNQNNDFDQLSGYQYMFRIHLSAILYVIGEVRAKPLSRGESNVLA